MKYWETLLQKQREIGKNGLTIPFLIGSQNYLPKSSHKQTIRELIEDMIKNDSFEKCLRYCIGTQTFIIEVRKGKNAVYYPKINEQDQLNFSVGLHHRNDFTDHIDELIKELIHRFQEPIDNEIFSAEPNVDGRSANWNKFSDKNISFIKDSFMALGS